MMKRILEDVDDLKSYYWHGANEDEHRIFGRLSYTVKKLNE